MSNLNREIMIKSLSHEDCKRILHKNYIGHLAYVYHNKPFVVPITYYYDDNRIICYSNEGHKISALRKYNRVAIEVLDIRSITKWKSVTVHGIFEELEGSGAKAVLHEFSLGIKNVVMRTELRDLDYISEFSAKISSDKTAIVFVINIEEMIGKMTLD